MSKTTTLSDSSSQHRRSQERGDVTKRRLVDAAIEEFASRGFDGVTLRDIEVHADVQRGLVKYHFGTKEDMWKAAVDSLFTELLDFRRERDEVERDMSPKERLAFRIRSFVRYSANWPDLNRMMSQEGKRDSWRMRYIIENYLLQRVLSLRDLVTANLNISSDEFAHWYYMYISAGAFMFSMEPEARKLFGIDVTTDEIIDRHAEMMVEFLLWRAEKTKNEERGGATDGR